ncbi:ENV1 protein, partial [Pardalotus punctatus]|nr:ENV1 protein [Pardalotus punctatus]
FYHSEDFVYDAQIALEHHLSKREPFTALTVATLMIMGGVGVGTGMASLMQQSKEFSALRVAVDEDLARIEQSITADLARIEQSITALGQSIRSLSKVVLQNRRALDLVLSQQGGTCVALNEECCVYTDHTSMARVTMAKLQEGLEKQKKEREAQASWFKSWFNCSPWLPTLTSTLMGPIVMITLALLFGPCILNRLMSFVKSWLDKVNILLVENK